MHLSDFFLSTETGTIDVMLWSCLIIMCKFSLLELWNEVYYVSVADQTPEKTNMGLGWKPSKKVS